MYIEFKPDLTKKVEEAINEQLPKIIEEVLLQDDKKILKEIIKDRIKGLVSSVITETLQGKELKLLVRDEVMKTPPTETYDKILEQIQDAETQLDEIETEIKEKQLELSLLKECNISEIICKRIKEYKNLDILIDYIIGNYPIYEVTQFAEVIERKSEIIAYNTKYNEVFLLKSYDFGETYKKIPLAKPPMYFELKEAEVRAIKELQEKPYKNIIKNIIANLTKRRKNI